MSANDFYPYTIIDYNDQYQDQLIELLTRIYAEYDQVIELDSLDSDLLEIKTQYNKPSCFKLLLDGQKVIASVAVKIALGKIELKRVFVDPDYRRQGLGVKLSDWAFDYAKKQGCEYIDIWSDTLFTKAHQLYQKLGADKLDETRSLGGTNDIEEQHFRKDLS